MAKLSVIIPSRDERFLVPTIRDIFRNCRSETEVVAVLDSDKWPDGWQSVAAEFPHLHTIHNGKSIGMRGSINKGVASAKSRGAKFIIKSDGHCSFSEGFDEVLKKDCDRDWVVVPRRGRLDPENWVATDTHKPDIDYHYLSFPDDPNDFGGPGLNGKVWMERALARKDIMLDEEMSSQGSCWFMHIDYFYQLELMDEINYGPFWNEMQEIGLKCWLGGGQLMVNKNAKYLHLHKGKKYGRGYRLPEAALKQGATFTKKWLFNEAWAKQALPFKTLIERFWPVPTWPENWEELVYGGTKLQHKSAINGYLKVDKEVTVQRGLPQLIIHSALYGVGNNDDIDVTAVLQRKVVNNSLDVNVTNADLEVGNPFRGQKKKLRVTYSYDGGEQVTVERDERDWLIIGQSARYVKQQQPEIDHEATAALYSSKSEGSAWLKGDVINTDFLTPDYVKDVARDILAEKLQSAPALNDFLIRRFQIPSHRLRGPMPIEVPTFHRNDLAQLFAELGFNKGAEIGVAEGKYSEVLCMANPNLELLCVDPWHSYKGNPQSKTKEKDEFAYNETKRRLAPYPNVKLDMRLSVDAVRDVADGSLDFVYVDAHHSFSFVMADIIAWSAKVRSGGIVAGDDLLHLDPKRWGAGPIEAVYAYTQAHNISPWFLIDAHKSVDYFWVKR